MIAEWDAVLDFLFVLEELPEEVMARYMTVRLQMCVSDLRRQHRMARMSGRGRGLCDTRQEHMKIVIESFLIDGLCSNLPPHRIDPEWSADTLESIMRLHRAEFDATTSSAMRDRLAGEFREVTGQEPRAAEHHAQILEAYLHSRLAALRTLDDQHAAQKAEFEALSREIMAGVFEVNSVAPVTAPIAQVSEQLALPSPSPQKAAAEDLVLTPGVELIKGPLTYDALSAQLSAAAASDESLHRNPSEEPFGLDIAGACERSIKRAMAKGKMDARTAEARRTKVKTFCLLTGLQRVDEVQQYHIRLFDELCDLLPKNFMRSPKDGRMTWQEIRERAEGMPETALGREPGTFNAMLDNISAVLKHARTNEGSPVDPNIDTSTERRKENKREREKRNAFKRDEVRRLFEHPVWTGCQSSSRRLHAGDNIERDGLYFTPLIVAYSGGRMEEIAGLTVDAIQPAEGHFGFDIRPHDQRRLKNLQSVRLIPIHEHLIELGLLDHHARMKARGETYLFPELVPKGAAKKFARQLRYNWKKIRDAQLDGNPRKLDAHSLRHSFNAVLKQNRSVLKDTRLDILGHSGEDLNEEVYGDEEGMPFALKKAAIDSIPRWF
ncbi:site-specific integrase [Roseivivax sp. THAF30]|uniref:site-specific integrase n=1 Tax=Roseivivax sp. THAF30 TaxID=2587852 RepID=UPI001267AADD|nr:site-specific integrase [Roseivivax sp. THAF30]QFT61986.1 hypothetical protein FIU91_03510 [Roseivivax sp. THAF30]